MATTKPATDLATFRDRCRAFLDQSATGPVTEQNRDVVPFPVGRHDVDVAVPVHVAGHDHPGSTTGRLTLTELEIPLPVSHKQDHLIGEIGGDEQILVSVPVCVFVSAAASMSRILERICARVSPSTYSMA